MKLINELLKEMGEYEEDTQEDYVDEEEAKEHAKEFLDRAASVLNYNKKPGDDNEVEKLALQYAKDYFEAICDNIKGTRYKKDGENGDDEEVGDEDVKDVENLVRNM